MRGATSFFGPESIELACACLLHKSGPMRRLRFVAFACAVGIWLAGARTTASDAAAAAGFEGADAAALREFLEGAPGRRDVWRAEPALVIISPVLDYSTNNVMSGYRASRETLSDADATAIALELTEAMQDLTDGAFENFHTINVEQVAAGETVKVFRPGTIVVARYHSLRAFTGNIGYGGRSTRNGTINAATVMLDNDFDRSSAVRYVLRTHELGHALGYHHVVSRPSVMNAKVGQGLTEFDRTAIRYASQSLARQP